MENEKQLALGGIFSGHDYRDTIAAASFAELQVTLPASFDTQLDSVVQMQGKIPACVSHSIVEIMKLYWFRKTGEWINFSPRFLDILSAESDIPLDGGRRPRTVLKIAMNQGCCTEKTLPNNVNLSIAQYRDKSVITQEMRDEASKYKIPGFINIAVTPQDRRKGVYLYGALSTLFAVGQELYTASDGHTSWSVQDIDPLRTPKIIESGHQMTVKGWQVNLDKLRNEWSKDWADKGENLFDPILWQPYIYEQWAIAEIPGDVSLFLKNLPAQKDFHFTWNTDLKLGDNTQDVKFAQVALMILGYLKNVPAEDLGIYGPKTAGAVLAYQQANGIYPTASGNIGPRTRSVLNKQFN